MEVIIPGGLDMSDLTFENREKLQIFIAYPLKTLYEIKITMTDPLFEVLTSLVGTCLQCQP